MIHVAYVSLQAHVVDNLSKPEAKLGNYIKKDHKYHINGENKITIRIAL